MNKLVEFIKSLFSSSEHFPGLQRDFRKFFDKNRDWLHEEIGLSPKPVVWIEKLPSQWKKYPIRNQDGSSSCVMQSGAKVLGIEQIYKNGGMGTFPVLSALDGYSQRSNKPDPGMNFDNAMKILKGGLCYESQLPSQNLSEQTMNAPFSRTTDMISVEHITKADGYVKFDMIDIDQIAGIIEYGKAVELGFSFSFNEWVDVPTLSNKTPTIRHAVAGVDYTMWNGEKAIVIDDSWGVFPRFEGQRVITESFLMNRCIYAGYLIDTIYMPVPVNKTKPKFVFTSPMAISDNSNEVISLQEALQYLGLFPINQAPTGYYGGITAKAVYDFQVQYGVDSIDVLNTLGGQRCGPKTLAKLNSLFN